MFSSWSSLSYDSSKASSKASSPHSAIQSFLLQMRISCPLRSFSSFLRLLPLLPVTSIPPFIFPSITRSRRQFLRKMWPIQFAFRLRISCRALTISTQLILSKLRYALYSEMHQIDKFITANYFLPLFHHFIMLLTFIISLHLPYVHCIHCTITGPVNDRTWALPHPATCFFFPKLYDVMKGTRNVYFPHLRLFSEPRNITLGTGTFRPISQANADILLPVVSRLRRKHMEL